MPDLRLLFIEDDAKVADLICRVGQLAGLHDRGEHDQTFSRAGAADSAGGNEGQNTARGGLMPRRKRAYHAADTAKGLLAAIVESSNDAIIGASKLARDIRKKHQMAKAQAQKMESIGLIWRHAQQERNA